MALFKKVSAATLALILSASTITASAAGSAKDAVDLTSRIGDADNNGSVNTKDFVAIADFIVSGKGEIYNVDFNFDKKKDAKDIVFLKKMLKSEKLDQFDAFAAYKSMTNAYLSTLKSTVESKVTSQLNDKEERTTESFFTRDGAKAELKSSNAFVVQNVVADMSGAEVDVYTKNIGKEDSWTKTTTAKTTSSLRNLVVDLFNKAQFDGEDDIVSVNIIDSLLLTDSVTEASFANAYTYDDGDYKYIAVPVEDIVNSKNADVTGTYMIQMDSKCNPIEIDIVIGKSTAGSSTIVENGYAKFTLNSGEVTLPDIAVKPVESPSNGDETPSPSPSAENPSPSPSAENPSPSPSAENPSPSPSAENPSPSPSAENPSPSPSIPVDPSFDDVKDLTVKDILVKSAKAFRDQENAVITGETSEEAVNGDFKYTNKVKVDGIKDGNNYKLNVTDGEFTFNDSKYTYTADAYATYGGRNNTVVYADGKVTSGDVTLNTGWLSRKSDISVADAKSETLSTARNVYRNVIDQIIEDKKAELAAATDEADITKLNKEIEAYETYRKSLSTAVKEQLDLVYPGKSELKALFTGDDSVSNRVNEFSKITTDGEKYIITIDVKALTNDTDKYIASGSGEFIYTVNKETFLPIRAEFKPDSTVKATDLNNGATATIETGYIDFAYPSKDAAKTVTIPGEALNGSDPVDYLKTNSNFTKFVADVIASKVKVD